MRIDIVKCHYDVHGPTYSDAEIFHITRGKEEKSAYFLDLFYSYNEAVRYGYKYYLRDRYVTWY